MNDLVWTNYQKKFDHELQAALTWLHSEYNKIRAGRANPNLLNGVRVEAYGILTNLNELANVQVPEPRTLIVKPYDPETIKKIVIAINKHNDELNPVIDGKLIRIIINPPTEESRKKAVKLIKTHLEKVKITVRNSRKSIQTAIKSADYQESLEQIYLEKLDKLVKEANESADTIFKSKEKELLTV